MNNFFVVGSSPSEYYSGDIHKDEEYYSITSNKDQAIVEVVDLKRKRFEKQNE
jgi:hypothetical protein